MAGSFENWENTKRQYQIKNEQLLEHFKQWLVLKKLTNSTINRHMRNIDLYINHFLLSEDPMTPEEGSFCVSRYLGNWFPRKVTNSRNAIKQSSVSISKFYTFLVEMKGIDPKILHGVKTDIKAIKP